MGTDLIIDSAYDDNYSKFMLAPPIDYREWYGRQIAWYDDPQVRTEIERRILHIYHSGNHALATQLASLYLQQTQREGGLFDFIEVTPSEHAKLDNFRRIGK